MIDVEGIAKEIRDDAEMNLKKLSVASKVEKILALALDEKWRFSYYEWQKLLVIVWSADNESKATTDDMRLATSIIETRWPGSRKSTGAYAGNQEGVFTVWRQFFIQGEVLLEVHLQGQNIQNCEVKFSEETYKTRKVEVGAPCLGLPDLEPVKDPS